MITNKQFIIIFFILCICIFSITCNHRIKHETIIDSIQTNINIRDTKIDSLNNELDKLKEVKFDTTKLKEEIKLTDDKINKIKYEKSIDTVSINDIDELQRKFADYFRTR